MVEFAFTASSYNVTEGIGAQAEVEVEIVSGMLAVNVDVRVQAETSGGDTATGTACLTF